MESKHRARVKKAMKIFCVDGGLSDRIRLKRRAKAIMPDAEICSCKSPKAALERAAAEGCDVLLTEIEFGERQYTGIDLAEEIKKMNPRVNIIFVTACPEKENAYRLFELRISGYLTKPYQVQELEEEFQNLRYSAV